MSSDLAFTRRIPVTHRMASGVAAGLLAGLAGVFITFFSRAEPLTSAWHLIPLAWLAGGVLLLVPHWRRFGGASADRCDGRDGHHDRAGRRRLLPHPRPARREHRRLAGGRRP